MDLEVAESPVSDGENMIFFLRIEIGGCSTLLSISLGVGVVALGIEISLNRSVIFATESSEEESEDDEEADEDELKLDARTGFLDEDAGVPSFFRLVRWSTGPSSIPNVSRSLMYAVGVRLLIWSNSFLYFFFLGSSTL